MAEGHQLPKRLAQELLSSMVERVTLHLQQGDRIRIGGLGTLVAFRPAKELKEAV